MLSARANTFLVLLAGIVPLALVPLVSRPLFLVGLAGALLAVWLAGQSIAFPLALAGVPSVIIAVLGRNPFPERSVAVAFAVWTLLAVLISVVLSSRALPSRALATVSVLGTGGLVAFMLARLDGSPDPAYGVTKLQLFIALNVLLLVGGIILGRSPRDVDTFALLLLLVGAASAFALLASIGSGDAVEFSADRLSLSIEDDPISLGRRGAEAILVAVYLLVAARSSIVRLAALALAPFVLAALLASGSRGPTLALLVGLVVLLALSAAEPRTGRRLALIGSGAVAAVVVAVLIAPGANVERSLSFFSGAGDADASTGRVELWSQGLDLFAENSLVGLGTGGFADVNVAAVYPHNIFIEASAELGFLGLGLLVVVLLGGLAAVLQSWRGSIGRDRLQAALVAALFAAALVNAQFSGSLADNAAVWLAIGLALGLRERLRERRDAEWATRESPAIGNARG